MDKWLFDISYIGKNYDGFVSQPTGRGILDYVENAFVLSGTILDITTQKISFVSRTDKGVNAISNFLVVECSNEPNLFNLNKFLPKDNTILIHRMARVKEEFLLNSITSKTYTYKLQKSQIDSKLFNKLERCNEFVGTYDFKNFIKKDRRLRPTVGTIETFDVFENQGEFNFTISGNRFGWQQIRRMIGFLTSTKFETKNPRKYLVDDSLKQLDIAPVSPYYLTLKEIKLNEPQEWESIDIKKILEKKISKLRELTQLTNFHIKLLNELKN